MDQDERRKLENQVLASGLPGLDSPAFMQILADMINQWPGDRNQFFVDMLNEVDAKDRYEAYHAMAPRLNFKPIAYTDCEASIAMRASALVSQGRARVEGKAPLPVVVGNREEKPQPKALIRCWCCGKKQEFFGETPVDAIIKARQAGWERTIGFDVETCPKCVERGKKPTREQVMKAAHA